MGATYTKMVLMRWRNLSPAFPKRRPDHSSSTPPRFSHPQDFSAVAERTGTYTAFDYVSIMEHLIDRWSVGKREGLSGEAAEAQEYLVKLPERITKLAERANVSQTASERCGPLEGGELRRWGE